MSTGRLKSQILQRLKLLHEQNPGLGIIPHPNQVRVYEQLFKAGMCRLTFRAIRTGDIGRADDPSHRRSFHFIDSGVGYTQEQLAAETARLAREANRQSVPVPPDPFQLAEHERRWHVPAAQK
jgi:hypothetical protein